MSKDTPFTTVQIVIRRQRVLEQDKQWFQGASSSHVEQQANESDRLSTWKHRNDDDVCRNVRTWFIFPP